MHYSFNQKHNWNPCVSTTFVHTNWHFNILIIQLYTQNMEMCVITNMWVCKCQMVYTNKDGACVIPRTEQLVKRISTDLLEFYRPGLCHACGFLLTSSVHMNIKSTGITVIRIYSFIKQQSFTKSQTTIEPLPEIITGHQLTHQKKFNIFHKYYLTLVYNYY